MILGDKRRIFSILLLIIGAIALWKECMNKGSQELAGTWAVDYFEYNNTDYMSCFVMNTLIVEPNTKVKLPESSFRCEEYDWIDEPDDESTLTVINKNGKGVVVISTRNKLFNDSYYFKLDFINGIKKLELYNEKKLIMLSRIPLS